MQKLSVPSGRWYENRERELTLPERWQVDCLGSPGLDKPGLTAEAIRAAIEAPVAGPPLAELARGKKQAVVVFDDMTRPTPVADVAPHILAALHQAGLERRQIRFLWSLGSHGTFNMIDARKKLGAAIVEQYAVFNHDPFQNVVSAGRTPTGVELWFNREFMACDLKIGIGCVSPHVQAGFSGGAKIVLPGVAGIESIVQFHNLVYRDRNRVGFGTFADNLMLAECNAAGDAAGLSFKVDCLINRRGEITDLYAGAFRATHAAGAAAGKEHYGFPHGQGYDLVICNSYGRASESAIALLLCLQLIKRREGTAVLISDAPEGQVPHYVMRSWGTDYGGRHFRTRTCGFVHKLMKKLIVLAPQPDCTSLDLICHNDDARVVKTWPETLAILEEDFPGAARVAVIPDGTMQYMKPPRSDA